MLTNALGHALVKHPKQTSFMKKLCNHFLIKSNMLYFQDKISIWRFLNNCPKGTD